jgi:hypothetical protein
MAVAFGLVMAWCMAACLSAVSSVPFARDAAPRQSVTAPALDKLRAAHQRVLDDLNAKNTGGIPLELDDPQVPELLKQGWGAAGAWAAAYLEAHPAPSTRELARIFEGFAPAPRGVKSKYGDFLEYPGYRFTGAAVRIGASLYVVQASYFMDTSTGTFMVVARNRDGRFQTLWTIKDVAEQHFAQKDEIGRWVHLVSRAYYNGPLNVRTVLSLSPATDGHARFLVDAYQSADGGTALAQLSIWEWDGAEAKPLMVELYQYAVGFGGFRFDGRTLQISTKEALGTLFSCGTCPEPRGVWTIRITSAGVRDLGRRFLTPELQWADELLTKIAKGEDTTTLAEVEVVEAVKALIRETQAEDKDLGLDPSEFSWGMLGQYRVLHRGQRGDFDLALDEGQLRFSYVLRHGRHYLTRVRISSNR